MNAMCLIVSQTTAPWLVAATGGRSPASLLEQFVISGGWITWFVLIPLSVVTLAMVIRHLIVVRQAVELPTGLARALVAASRQGQVQRILEITRDDDTMLGQAAFAGVSNIGQGPDMVRAAIDEMVEERTATLSRKIEYLSVIGNVSPMIGLLGTVVGMIQAFNRIYSAGGGVPETSKLVGDIAIALVNTFWGLAIAIPALTAYAFFRNRIDAFAAECVRLCDGLVTAISDRQTTT